MIILYMSVSGKSKKGVIIMSKRPMIFTLLFVVLILWAPLALASFVVSPLHLDFETRPGEAVTHYLTVTNTGADQITVNAYLKDFKIEPDGKDSELQPGTVNRSCSKWISVRQIFKLDPKDKKKIPIAMSVPPDASGSYWCDVFVAQISDPKPRKLKKGEVHMVISVLRRWKIRIYATALGNEIKSGRITDMQIVPASEEKPPSLSVEFENMGNIILKCNWRVEIRDEDGQMIREALLNEKGVFTGYPHGKRVLKAEISKKLPPGNYIALAIIDYGGEELVAGELELEVK
jgi:hypothetical protein